MSIDSDSQGTSTRPYLVRALHDWCTDNGFTPLLAVHVDESVRVPMEFVKNNEIVLNVSFDATSGLRLGNEFIEF
jgi:stringent starvation protein B